jgi:hypothetical protein
MTLNMVTLIVLLTHHQPTYVRSLQPGIYSNLQLKDMNVNISLGRNLLFLYVRNKQDITLKPVYFHRMYIPTYIYIYTLYENELPNSDTQWTMHRDIFA